MNCFSNTMMTRDRQKKQDGAKPRGETLARWLPMMAAALAAVALAAGQLVAADPNWTNIPQYVPPHAKFRGSGNYLSLVKLLACWFVFVAWVKTTDWVSVDSQTLKLDCQRWTAIVFGVFLGAFILAWLLPMFAVAFPLLVLAYIIPLTLYILHRNAQVPNNRRVLTPEHLRFVIGTLLNKFGAKVQVEKKDPMEAGPPVKLLGRSGVDAVTDNARVGLARQTAGFLPARELLAESLSCRADALMLDFAQESVAVHTMVDGVWIPRESRGRDVCDPALETLKVLCGLSPQDRQNRQEGKFAAEYEKKKRTAAFMSQGTPTGERMIIQFEEDEIPRRSLDELGLRTKLQEEIREQIDKPGGLLLFSAGPGCGLRSTLDAVLHTTDRFVREFAAFENIKSPYQYVENIPITTFDPAGEEPLNEALRKFFRREPNAAVIRDLVDGPMVDLLCEATTHDRVVFSTMRAGDCAEALLRVLALGASAEAVANAVTLVVNQRLVRKLCDKCKEAYTPTPQMLQQLGIPQGRVQAFYRPPTPNPQEPKEPCSQCGGIGYFGRTGLFELLVVGDTVRKVLTAKPRLDLLRQAARRDGMKSFQEEGIFLVAKGITSLPELMRVLK
jgi:type II secretory ATPase GspE/PulE/Tfp pilus assembly ATPase PilB-like protein